MPQTNSACSFQTAQIDPSAVIGPNVTIGPRCVIGKGVRLQRCAVLEGARVKDHAWVHSSIIGWNSTVGRWVRMENISVLGDDGELHLDGRLQRKEYELNDVVNLLLQLPSRMSYSSTALPFFHIRALAVLSSHPQLSCKTGKPISHPLFVPLVATLYLQYNAYISLHALSFFLCTQRTQFTPYHDSRSSTKKSRRSSRSSCMFLHLSSPFSIPTLATIRSMKGFSILKTVNEVYHETSF